MYRTPLLFTLLAAAAIAGCDSKDHTIVQNGPVDPMANVVANAGPVELPPAIVESKIYRCKDNSILYVDWLAEGKGANVRIQRTAASTPLKPGADGKPPFTAEGGYSLAGTPQSKQLQVELPGKGKQPCSL